MTDTPITPHERVAHARHGYSSLQITYHWSIVVLVVTNWLVGHGMEEVYQKREAGEYFSQWGPAFVHIALGMAILGTMIARLITRIQRPVETAGDTKHHIMKVLAWINHWAFYAVLISMPILGALAWFLAWNWAAALHSFLAWLLPFLILVHVGGAVVHLVLGENVFRRMLRGTSGT
jgi:cytochrome b561